MKPPIRFMEICRKAREWAEKYAREKTDFDRDLCGLCAIASAKLHVMLKRAKYETTIVYGDGHVFLLWEDHVVDITATQFGRRKIFIIPYQKLHKEHKDYGYCDVGPWSIMNRFKKLKGLWSFQQRHGWPKEQCIKMDSLKTRLRL